MQTGKFSQNFKVAKIMPLDKGRDANTINNYRPISILTTVSKLLEKLIHKSFTDYFNKYKIIFDNQFGF